MKLFVLKLASVFQFQEIRYTRFRSADLDLLLNSVPVSYTNMMLVRINKCLGKVTTVSFFFVFIFFMNLFFLSKFSTFEIRKIRSNCLDLYLAFLLHFAMIRYTRIQSANLLNCTRILYH